MLKSATMEVILMTTNSNRSSRSAAHVIQSTEPFGDKLFTTQEVATYFGVAETTVREWINEGELLAISFGKSYRISETALRETIRAKEDERRQQMVARRHERELRRELKGR